MATRKPRYRPSRETFSAPIAVALTHESEWDAHGNHLGPFSIHRLNFSLEMYPLGVFGYGEAAEYVASPSGTTMTMRQLIRYEFERVDRVSILQEHLESSDLTSALHAKAQTGPVGLGSASFAASIEEHLTESFRENRTVESSNVMRSAQEREVSVEVPGGGGASVHAVPYERWAIAVRLSHIDYLEVVYRVTHAGLRIRRTKSPELIDERTTHTNYRPSGVPLGELRFWRPSGGANTNLIPLGEYNQNHINPRHVDVRSPKDPKTKFYGLGDFRRTPSLYKISNAAFPLKATQHHTTWTTEDLLALRDLEPNATAWIWERRRHTRRKGWGLAGPSND